MSNTHFSDDFDFENRIMEPTELPEDFQPQLSFEGMERVVCDYIAGMTDHYAVMCYSDFYVPKFWKL